MTRIGWVLLVAVASCAPSDEQIVKQFQENRQTIQSLRTELCRNWGQNGGVLAETWLYPELPAADGSRLQATLGEIGAQHMSVSGENCGTAIQMWSGSIIDLGEARVFRQGAYSIERDFPDEPALCDCVERTVPLENGWVLRFTSFTWVS